MFQVLVVSHWNSGAVLLNFFIRSLPPRVIHFFWFLYALFDSRGLKKKLLTKFCVATEPNRHFSFFFTRSLLCLCIPLTKTSAPGQFSKQFTVKLKLFCLNLCDIYHFATFINKFISWNVDIAPETFSMLSDCNVHHAVMLYYVIVLLRVDIIYTILNNLYFLRFYTSL